MFGETGMGKKSRGKFWPRCAVIFYGLVTGLVGAPVAAEESFFDLDLEEVLNLEITSVSKKPQTVSQAAAAVFVITADDIRRSGAKSIPEVLRMAPGLQVAQISANTWAVSSRGLNGRFANKLLVLMDGRSVYTPTFSGVYWDVQDTMMADIERIEVIRGPGAALWGANAVNGVINIISKSAAATQGGLLSVSAGMEERASGEVRYGGEAGAIGHWRVYGKGFKRDAGLIEEGKLSAGDDTWQGRTGFRADLAPTTRDRLTVQGDFYKGRSGESSVLYSLTPPYHNLVGSNQDVSGWNLLGRWQRELSEQDSMTLQAYVDHTRRDWPGMILKETRTTYDVDFQYRNRQFQGHDIVTGASWRLSQDRIGSSFTGIPNSTLPIAFFNSPETSRKLFSLFLQDDITLVPDKLVLTLGTKLERNDYTGVEHQPNARLLWMPHESTTFWGSVARAVRTPSRVERGSEVNLQVLPPMDPSLPLPLLTRNINQGFSAETLMAYELGWKQRLTSSLSVDLALFYNDYDKLRTASFRGMPTCQPSGAPIGPGCFFPVPSSHMLQLSDLGNDSTGRSHGLELAADWRVTPNLKFQFAWSWLNMRLKAHGASISSDLEDGSPQHQFSLRTAWNPRADIDVDLWLRRVGRIEQYIKNEDVTAYTEADLRLAWRPEKTVEIALVGRNLLHRSHQEAISELGSLAPMLIERSVFVQVNKKF